MDKYSFSIIERAPDYQLVLLILGLTATIIPHKLYDYGFWIVDIGSLNKDYLEYLRYYGIGTVNSKTIEDYRNEIVSVLQ